MRSLPGLAHTFVATVLYDCIVARIPVLIEVGFD